MTVPESFRDCYDAMLIDPHVADAQYSCLGEDAPAPLSRRIMKPIAFAAAMRCAIDDIENQTFCRAIPAGVVHMSRESDGYFAHYQRYAQHTWSGFFDSHLVGWFEDLNKSHLGWRNQTNLTLTEVIQAKSTELKSVQSHDSITQARKRAAYLTIAALAHCHDPLSS